MCVWEWVYVCDEHKINEYDVIKQYRTYYSA